MSEMTVSQSLDPGQTRIGLLEEMLRAARAYDDDDYAAAYDSLIEFEREFGAYDSDEMTCVVCGCTNNWACEGGCVWVVDSLCSSCLVKLAEVHLGVKLPGGGQAHGEETQDP